MASSINASTSGAGGVITTADNSGILNLQSNGTTVATVSSSGFSTPANQTINTANTFGFKNRLINGAQTIAQRGTSAQTISTTAVYPCDRFGVNATLTSGSTTIQSSTVPTAQGFKYSSLVTIGTGATPSGADYFRYRQIIEGFNIADLAWGTANAKTVTVSFWVRCSLTGNFGFGFQSTDSGYGSSYTINSANTWEFKTITIPGPTSGTWATDNTLGLNVCWDLGEGPSRNAASLNTWSYSSTSFGLSGGVKLCATSGATWYITGVQLEVGSQATSFDFRDYGRELQMCQRYYTKSYPVETAPNTVTNDGIAGGITQGSDRTTITHFFKVNMRTAPTVTIISYLGNNGYITATTGANAGSSCAAATIGTTCLSEVYSGGTALSSLTIYRCHYTASAEL